jgi:uncharacterized protein (DUF885 family)
VTTSRPPQARESGFSADSSDVFRLSSECVDALGALRPVSATYQGIPGHDHEWDDYSPRGVEKARETLGDFQRRLRALKIPSDRWNRLASVVMEELLQHELDWYEWDEHLLDLNNITSTFQSLRDVFDVMDTTSAKGWENVITRLETIDAPFEGYRRTLEEGRGRGRVVARRQVQAAIKQGKAHSGDKSFFNSLPGMMDKAGIDDTGLKERLLAAIPNALRSFGRFTEYLEKTYLPDAIETDAVGRDRYLRHTRRFLGMEIDPLETYEWGWSQVREIESAMHRAAGEIKSGAPLGEVIELLKSDPKRCAPSQEAFARTMLERQHQALRDLEGTHFDVPEPIRTVNVKITPPGGPLTAYYVPPTEDFSRPGTVWYSFADKQVFPLYDEVSTAYHEGFPGHHLQCGIQVSLADRLSRLHRLMFWYPGYGEGWALYAEHLMNELGYFEKPDYVLGMLANQLMRACRVVIDIGSHLQLPIPGGESFHPGEAWSFDLGVEMLTKRCFLDPDHADSEVTRYLGWPGQAISYKVGQRVILELREELRRRQGSAFDLKEFHSRVLGSGPVGLQLLKRLVLEGEP